MIGKIVLNGATMLILVMGGNLLIERACGGSISGCIPSQYERQTLALLGVAPPRIQSERQTLALLEVAPPRIQSERQTLARLEIAPPRIQTVTDRLTDENFFASGLSPEFHNSLKQVLEGPVENLFSRSSPRVAEDFATQDEASELPYKNKENKEVIQVSGKEVVRNDLEQAIVHLNSQFPEQGLQPQVFETPGRDNRHIQQAELQKAEEALRSLLLTSSKRENK